MLSCKRKEPSNEDQFDDDYYYNYKAKRAKDETFLSNDSSNSVSAGFITAKNKFKQDLKDGKCKNYEPTKEDIHEIKAKFKNFKIPYKESEEEETKNWVEGDVR